MILAENILCGYKKVLIVILQLGESQGQILVPRHNKRWKIPFPIQLKSVFYAKNRKKT